MGERTTEKIELRGVALQELLKVYTGKEGRKCLNQILSSFSCEKDKDIESFLYNRAITFETVNKGRTYFVCDEAALLNDGRYTIYGYFTVALKVLDLPDTLSNTRRKQLDGLSAKLHGEVIRSVPCYLIGQLAKNSAIENNPLTGAELMNKAISVIRSSVSAVGGRYALIECHDDPFLRKFYTDNDFTEFDTLPYEDISMVQMLRPLCENVPEDK